MENDESAYGGCQVLTVSESIGKELLLAFLMQNTEPLLGTLRSYVQHMGLASGNDVKPVALDVLQEVVVEALDHAGRFNTTRQPMAWLLGISINVIKRKKTEFAKRAQREISIAHLATNENERLSEVELFDLLTSCPLEQPDQNIEANEQALMMLSLVSLDDQHILRMAFLEDFDRAVLAKRLGITDVAAGWQRSQFHLDAGNAGNIHVQCGKGTCLSHQNWAWECAHTRKSGWSDLSVHAGNECPGLI
ncbi:MAG: sigma-70 family RNA polymerase sigma factor [Ktedonobacteraceae bacterium]|nr:sigma-70 family RNA polymerase sigma factor [Ktedonobacteraceae bacterium]